MIALTRAVSPAIARCELTHLARTPIDIGRAVRQHEAYERLLERLGCTIRRLPAGDDMPDSVFIEDTAVVLDEVAVVARPGAASRRHEVPAVAEALRSDRVLRPIVEPGTLDGGDVLVAGRTVFAGRSSRTNDPGVEQLRQILAPLGYRVHPVGVHGCLHLKSAATALDDRRLLVNPLWVPVDAFAGFEVIAVHPEEPSAANVARVGDRLVAAAAFPKTAALLEARGYSVHLADVSELAKAEGAVTCCNLLIVRAKARSREPGA